MTEPSVSIHQLNVQYPNNRVLHDLSLVLNKGEHLLIGGKSGSGKTTLAKSIAEVDRKQTAIQIEFDPDSLLPATVIYVANWYQFTNLEGERNFYYQQRYNKHQGQDTLTVQADLEHFAKSEGLDSAAIERRISAMGFEHLKQSQLIELSSGEHKKLQLIKGLWVKPQLLILDEPYTGLDTKSRIVLNNWLDDLVAEGVQLIVISNDEGLPTSVNSYAHIVEGKLVRVDSPLEFAKDKRRQQKELPSFLKEAPSTPYLSIAELKNIFIRYGEKVVLKDVSWKINVGDKWLLQGPNGSGKSTLLSLINGDHPQAYGHDITLFGYKRGSGESIWDIKEKIGIISPEMHWYFDQHATVWHTIASGFYDSIGWFVAVKFEEKKKIEELLEFFGLTEYKDKLLVSLPLGKQRLALLARTIVKNPPLLVLDEPCQGLDVEQTTYFNNVVDELTQHGKTLIYVGHYESLVPSSISHKIVLAEGKVIATTYNIKNDIHLESIIP